MAAASVIRAVQFGETVEPSIKQEVWCLMKATEWQGFLLDHQPGKK